MIAMERRLLTVDQAGEMLGLGRVKVYELIKRGDISTVRVGRLRRIAVADLDDYVTRLRTESGGPS